MEYKREYNHWRSPYVYSFRTNNTVLRLLKVLAAKEHRYKNDIMEDALIEYFEKHFQQKFNTDVLSYFEQEITYSGKKLR